MGSLHHRCLWLLICLSSIMMTAHAQIEGLVADRDSRTPLKGARIYLDSVYVTESDGNGRFSLSAPGLISIYLPGYVTIHQLQPSAEATLYFLLEPNTVDLPEVTIGAYGHVTSWRKASGSIEVLPGRSLQLGTSTYLNQALNQVNGVVMHQGALNTNRLVIRGIGSRSPFSTNRIRAFLDDIPVTTGEGATTLEDVDMAMLGRIEVLKGPESALYGASMGGVINLYTRQTAAPGFGGDLFTEAGSFGTLHNTLAINYNNDRSFSQLQIGQMHQDGFRQNSRYDRQNLLFTHKIAGKKSVWRGLIHVAKLHARIPSSLDSNTWVTNPAAAAANWLAVKGYEQVTKWNAGLNWQYVLSHRLFQSLTLFTNGFDQYESRPFNILADQSVSGGLRNRWTLDLNTRRILLGWEFYSERYDWDIFQTQSGVQGPLINRNLENRRFLNTYISIEQTIGGSLKLDAALNMNTLAYTVKDRFQDATDVSGSYSYSPRWSPRLGFNYAPGDQWQFFGALAHGFSPPTVEEALLPSGTINPDLLPESGWSAEAGLRQQKTRWAGEIVYYQLWLQNLLVTKRLTEDIFTGINAGETRHRGLEAKISYELIPKSDQRQGQVAAAISTSTNRFEEFNDNGRDISGNLLPGIPSWVLNLTSTWVLPFGLDLFVQYRHSGKQWVNDANTISYPGENVFNTRWGYNFKPGKTLQWQLFGGINNLLDEKYAGMFQVNAVAPAGRAPRYYYPGTPRYLYGGLRLSF